MFTKAYIGLWIIYETVWTMFHTATSVEKRKFNKEGQGLKLMEKVIEKVIEKVDK